MIETTDRVCAPNTENMIKAIADYLREGPLGRHRDLMRAELIELIGKEEKLPIHVVQNALRSADVEVVRAIKARGIKLSSCPLVLSMSAFSFAQVPTATRVEIFKLIADDIAPDHRSLSRVVAEAFSARDPALVDAALAWAPDRSFDDIVWASGRFENDAMSAPNFWRNMIDRIDPNSQATAHHARKWLTTNPAARSLAVMVARGLRLGPIITETRVVEDRTLPWVQRLRARAASAHGEMELRRSLPSIGTLLEMPIGHVETVLAGLSKNQERKLRRSERKGKVPRALQDLKNVIGEL